MEQTAPLSKIRVAEIFYSLQGEGLYTGVPSIFLRMFGCNFKCAGFSMPRGQLSKEYLSVDPSKYSRYDDLPLVHTGCDSYAAWDHRFKHLSPWMTFDEIAAKMAELLPHDTFGEDVHLILTGGEPMLWQKQLPGLLDVLEKDLDVRHLTIETNGTQELETEFEVNLDALSSTTFSVSAKLPCSGEKWEKAIRPEVIKTYDIDLGLCGQGYFKFVVATKEDCDDALKAVHQYREAGINWPVYLMPAGGTTTHYNLNQKYVAELCKRYGFRYSQRLQLDLWKNAWGT